MEKGVLPLAMADFQEGARVLGRAFQDDPVAVSILRAVSPTIRVKRLTVAFSADLNACERRGMPIHVREDDRIAGVAIVHPPGTYPLPITAQMGILLKTVLRNGPYGFGRWLTYLSHIEKQHLKDPHYYLEFIGVEPDLHGKGLGSSMLKHLASSADQDQVGCFLETGNPKNVPLYQRFGFETVAEEQIIGVNTWFMWRSPS
ncbi:MAG: GNAT family N-acetyltransferase [Deltaproteobacteria bacterium]|nr:GNAT family N-acetyltransferase [Deltaproteobacteria bacterium]